MLLSPLFIMKTTESFGYSVPLPILRFAIEILCIKLVLFYHDTSVRVENLIIVLLSIRSF